MNMAYMATSGNIDAPLFLHNAHKWQQASKKPLFDAYTPLRGEEAIDDIKISEDQNVTPFRNAGVLSRMTFWLLNPILKKGKVKVLEDSDLPKLQPADCSETCYSLFMEQLSAQMKKGTSGSLPVLSTLFIWQRKAVLQSGIFALSKVLAVATGPLLLKAFIRVAQGNEAFKYEMIGNQCPLAF
ncbi:hypothetical protein POM88_033324 [Heracleum sosnowskyi]|uniref:Uncharacterized protein n=1 Tax=Heracleum sosnowskyi TaxID=360622 RepID=A0AAD8MKW6_9APIA|nr:hypothetical protein POM88_033324 [Heracleum sosnowskyi]